MQVRRKVSFSCIGLLGGILLSLPGLALAQDERVESMEQYRNLELDLRQQKEAQSGTYGGVKCSWLLDLATVPLMWEMQGIDKAGAKQAFLELLTNEPNRDVVKFMSTVFDMEYAMPEKGPEYLKSGTFMELCLMFYLTYPPELEP